MNQKKNLLTLVIITLIAFFIGWLLTYQNSSQTGSKNNTEDPFFGNPESDIAITIYGEYHSPRSKSLNTLIKMIQVQKKQDIFLTWKDYPSPSNEFSWEIARAANCAYLQDKFWDYHMEIFDNYRNWFEVPNVQTLKIFLNHYAEQAGIDISQFKTCLEEKEAYALIQENIKEGQSINLSYEASPHIYWNGEKIKEEDLAQRIQPWIK